MGRHYSVSPLNIEKKRKTAFVWKVVIPPFKLRDFISLTGSLKTNLYTGDYDVT